MSTKKKDTPAAEKFQNLARAINGKAGSLPPFDRKFYAVQYNNGTRDILEAAADGVVTPVLEDAVITAILLYCEEKLGKHKGFQFDHATAMKAMRYWLSTAPVIEPPARLLELSEPGLCYKRLPFDSVDDCFQAPLFEEFLSRCYNARALLIFVGSLFYEDADRQQYLYLYGDGGDGKGSFLRFLEKVFGSQYQAESSTFKPNQFTMAGYLGKRLIVFPDSNNPKIGMSELVKTITGNDPVRIEEKYKPTRTEMLRCKLIIVSNQSPILSSLAADQRRIILCEVAKLKCEVDLDYEELLWKEAPFIVGFCKALYKQHAVSKKIIPSDRYLADVAAAESEQKLADLFTQNFVEDSSHSISGSELCYILGAAGVKDGMHIKDFTAYAARKHNVRKERKEMGVIYFGLRAKMSMERAAHISVVRGSH